MDKLLKLNELGNGALQEQFALEVKKVINNIDDPKTSDKAKRKISINLTFEPDGEGFASLQYEVKSTLAPQKKRESKIVFGISADGNIECAEFGKGAMPGQVTLEEVNDVKEETVESNKIRRIGGNK